MPGTAPALVYGVVADQIVLLDDAWAQSASRDLDRWRRVTTNGEAIALAADGCEVLDAPFDVDDFLEVMEEDGLTPGDGFSLDDCEWVSDFSWPGVFTADFVPRGWDVGEDFANMVSSGYLIDQDEESKIVDLAQRDDVPIRRDDDLIERLTLG